jgi:hypothetical protein
MKKVIFGALALSVIMFSCSKQNEKGISKEKVDIKSESYGFDESVSIVFIGTGITENGSEYIKMDIKSFNPIFRVNDSYYIDNVQYTDDGNFNDEFANDGIYSSIQSGDVFTENENLIVNTSPEFKYNKELKNYLYDNYITAAGPGVSLGCDVSLTTCSETSWWNSCWPLSSPCTCVEFSNCHAEISYSW